MRQDSFTNQAPEKAPPFEVSSWMNLTDSRKSRLSSTQLTVVYAFQMLCPGCVSHSIPQAKRLQIEFAQKPVEIVGLHTVFEDHADMTSTHLADFVVEQGLTFPIAIDAPDPNGGDIPVTMRRYSMEGTPTVLLIDAHGQLHLQHFGHLPDEHMIQLIYSVLDQLKYPKS